MKLKHALLMAALAVGSTGCVIHVRGNANSDIADFSRGWDKLGEHTVDFNVDKDTFEVTNAQGEFRAIGLRVSGAPVDVHDIRVTFGDGTTYSPNVRQEFRPGSLSRRIDLPGNRRVIRRVDFVYQTARRGGGRATVELFGQR
ncbi:MAG: hypothetical protein FJ096_14205 [Deltaproteobacteria bacterium]|nr:hypothetical protein [Deltaproteobacteria bacterium]